MTIKTYLMRCKRENLIWLFWILINSLCVFLNGIFSANAITALVTLSFQEFLFYGLAILFINILWAVQIYQGARANEKAIQAMTKEIRKDISLRLEQAGIKNFEDKNSSTYLSWLTNDIQTISELGFETLELMLMQSLNIIFAIVAFFSFHYSILVTIIIFFILMVSLPKLFNKKLEKATLTFTEKNEELVQAIDDVLKGYRNLINTNKGYFITSNIVTYAEKYSQSRIEYAKTLGGLMAVQNGTSFISQITVLLHAGILYFYKLIPLGGVSSSQYFASIIFAGLTGLTANYAEFKSVHKIFDKFEAIGQEELTLKESYDDKLIFKGDIRLENTSISRGNQNLFDNLSLHFKSNGKYALIGKSGIGKSSLLKVINQEIDITDGQVFYDNILSDDISSTKVRNSISFISTEDHIFNESVRFNLTLGEEKSMEDLTQVLENLSLRDWVDSLPNGLDTQLSQTKSDISSGQKQRLILARALLQNRPIWLIDEGTNAIDESLRLSIERDILSREDKTIIFVTHHLTTELIPYFENVIDLNKFV